MRLFCVWCKQFLSGSDVCVVLPAGTCWPWGAAWCVRCCPHQFHGLPLARDRQAA